MPSDLTSCYPSERSAAATWASALPETRHTSAHPWVFALAAPCARNFLPPDIHKVIPHFLQLTTQMPLYHLALMTLKK